MCNGVCRLFTRKNKQLRYCSKCMRYISEENLHKEKKLERLRCNCCKRLVRIKIHDFHSRYSSAQAIANIARSS